jgi:DNA-binding transcriptional regulator YdaS (Cro superfamily)
MIQKIVEWFGSQSEMARQLRVDRSAVTHWVNSGALPPKRAIELEKLSNGLFKAVDIMGAEDAA